jgi:prepilin-type N-terminal cleavage/methylation domain-containing protein
MKPRRGNDSGFTLTELLVVMTLSGILGGIVVVAATTGLHKQTQVQDRADALSQTRTALQRIDRDIRSSNPLALAQDNEIVLIETQATVTRTMTYSLVPDGTTYDLEQDESDVTNTGAAMPEVAPVELLRNVVNPAGSPVFQYVKSPTYTVPSDGSVDASCVIAGKSPVTYDPTCIGTVVVHLEVEPPSLSGPVDMTDNGTDLRNPA